MAEADPAQGRHQHVGERREPQAKLVRRHGCGRRAVGEEIELLLLDAVLHLAAGAVDLLVEGLRVDHLTFQRGDDEPRVGAPGQVLGLPDDATAPAPRVDGRVAEVLEPAYRLAGLVMFVLGPGHVDGQRLEEPAVASEAEDVIDPVRLAPAISTSRAKLPSARSTMCTRGQRARSCATIRATSSTVPADASMLDRRSFAASRWRPQNTHSGR